MAGRIERRIVRINDQLIELDAEEQRIAEELSYHRHINDDAVRDAVLDPGERGFARSTSADVARFERALEDIIRRKQKLIDRRQVLFDRLGHL